MKNKVLILALLVLLTDCGKTADIPASIDIRVKEVVFSQGSGEKIITVNCNKEFAVSSSSPWCEASPLKDQTGVRVTVTANEATQDRAATLTVLCGKASEQINVIQSAFKPSISVNETRIDLNEQESRFTLEITANIPVVFDLPEWIREKDNNVPVTGKKTCSFQAFFIFAPKHSTNQSSYLQRRINEPPTKE